MILDSSAVIAVLREEPGHEQLQVRLEQADAIEMGAPTLFQPLLFTGNDFARTDIAPA